jgi:D-alanyl-D-alanine dipeptidase
MNEIIVMSDPRVAAVPVRECGESVVDARLEDSLLFGVRQEDRPAAFFVREGVLDRLAKAQASLPGGLRLLFVEGYRPLSVQRRYFDGYAARLRADNPGWPAGRLTTAVSRFVSPPEIAPHSAGAAVDLTLADADGRELDLGTSIDATPEDSAGACYTAADNIGEEARANRGVLAAAMEAAGLVNYPTEWWHWSFGDRYWALATGAAAALYSPVETP